MGQSATKNNNIEIKIKKDNALHKYLKNKNNYLKAWVKIQQDINGLLKNPRIALDDLDNNGDTALHIVIERLSLIDHQNRLMHSFHDWEETLYASWEQDLLKNRPYQEETCINIFKIFLNKDSMALTTKGKKGNIPLHLLCHISKPNIELLDIMITKMIDNGCDLNIKNKDKQTPFDLIFCQGSIQQHAGVGFSDSPGQDEKILVLAKNDTRFSSLPEREKNAAVYFTEAHLCKFYMPIRKACLAMNNMISSQLEGMCVEISSHEVQQNFERIRF